MPSNYVRKCVFLLRCVPTISWMENAVYSTRCLTFPMTFGKFIHSGLQSHHALRKRFFSRSLASNHGHLFTTLKWYWGKDDNAEWCHENTLANSSLQGMNHSNGPSSLTPDPILLKNVIDNFCFWDSCGRTNDSW